MPSRHSEWFVFTGAEHLPTPALVLYPERISRNIRRMIELAGGPKRLRPHVKTHKIAELVRVQRRLSIAKFKCATIAEAEMVVNAGATDILIAYPAVGPTPARLAQLAAAFPKVSFSVLVDSPAAAKALSEAACFRCVKLEVLVDLDCGMHRTGLPPGDTAATLYANLARLPSLVPGGLHAYDGHIHAPSRRARAAQARSARLPVIALRDRLLADGLPVPRVVIGGSPTFALHAAADPAVEVSPGTCVLWDFGYEKLFPDLGFLQAAVLLTRVISRPGSGLLCLDLGYKAVAAESSPPHVCLPDLPDAKTVAQSEEHLVVATSRADAFTVGDLLHALPRHICPTVALYAEVMVVRRRRLVGQWHVAARDRRLTY